MFGREGVHFQSEARSITEYIVKLWRAARTGRIGRPLHERYGRFWLLLPTLEEPHLECYILACNQVYIHGVGEKGCQQNSIGPVRHRGVVVAYTLEMQLQVPSNRKDMEDVGEVSRVVR